MIKLKRISLLISLIHLLKTICQTGCQRCVNKKCEICDQSRFYLQNNECLLRVSEEKEIPNQTSLDNCIQIDFDNKCKQCTQYYYLNIISGYCEGFPNGANISNCLEYVNKECQRCRNGFYLQNKLCQPVPQDKLIDNCIQIQNDNFQICEICKQGFIPSLNRSLCISSNITNCLFFSYLDCSSCMKDQFLVNKDNYITKIINDKNSLFDIFLQSSSLKKKISFFPVCFQKMVKNCLVFKDTDNCQICENNFYLKTVTGKDVCIPTPVIVKIKFCLLSKTILGNEICLLCENNYLLKNGVCITFTKIENCLTHYWEKNSQQILCSECFMNYILKSNNLDCLKINLIENCEFYEYSNNNSTCKKCKENYFLTTSKDVCYQSLKNCQINECRCEQCQFLTCVCDKNCKKIKLACLICSKEYFYNGVDCVTGEIPNCEIYLNINQCQSCQSGYILKNNFCVRGILEFCEIYSQENSCEVCEKNYVATKITKQCSLVPFPPVMEKMFDDCETFNLFQNNQNFLDCNVCKNSTIPVNLLNTYFCFSLNEAYFLNNQFSSIENCLFYNQEMQCEKCFKNFYLYNNKCLSNCGTMVHINSIFVDEANKVKITDICLLTIPLANCVRAILLQNTTNPIIYICQECAIDYNLYSDYSNSYSLKNLIPGNLLIANLANITNTKCEKHTESKITNCLIPLPSNSTSPNLCFFCKSGYIPVGNSCVEDQDLFKDIIGFSQIKNPRIIQYFISVPICNNNKIPIIDGNKNVTICVNPIDQTTNGYLENCAYYYFSTNYFCLFCKPGYYSLTDITQRPDVCNQIVNCDVNLPDDSLIYGACTKCMKGFAFRYALGAIQMDCIQTLVENCFAAYENGSCFICQEKFQLINNICENINFLNCESTNLGNLIYFDYNTSRLLVAVKNEQIYFKGCEKCFSNYYSIKVNYDLNFCESSSYLKNKEYISHCQSYYRDNENKIKCNKCFSNFSLTFDFNTCISTTKLNCLQLDQSSSNCSKCDLGQMSLDGNCVPIAFNCKNMVKGICMECETGYVLLTIKNSQTSCFQIHQNCSKAILTSENSGINSLECLKCDDFFNLEDNIIDCEVAKCVISLNKEDTCIKYDNTKYLNNSTFQCLECNYKTHYKDILLNTCILRQKVDENCTRFDKCADQCEGSCKCGDCLDLTNLNGCKDGYFFDSLEYKICLKYLIGGCDNFLDENNCSVCKSDYYLKDGVCIILEKGDIIDNCLKYEFTNGIIVCKACFNYKNLNNFFYIKDNKCQISNAKNCKSNINENECELCYSSYYLEKDSENIISCIKNTSDCIFYDEIELELFQNNQNNINKINKLNISSGHCKSCQSSLEILDNTNFVGSCNQNKFDLIKNCQTYEKKPDGIICTKCESEFALKSNACEPIFFISQKTLDLCNNFFYNFEKGEDLARCSLCDLGFFLKEEKCLPCERINVLNCFICIPSVGDNLTGECLFCKSGFYMDENKICNKNLF